MDYYQIRNDLLSIEKLKTKGVDRYNKALIKKKIDVSFLEQYILEDKLVYRTFFQVSLAYRKTYAEQFAFIEEKAFLLDDWWAVDQMVQYIKKPVDFAFAFQKASQYVCSELTFLRRWGYVLFLTGLQKDYDNVRQILSLMKDDDEYYVQMAEAWIIADMASFQFDLVYDFLSKSKMKYNILGKAIQKICDSFKVTNEQKTLVKELRSKLKLN